MILALSSVRGYVTAAAAIGFTVSLYLFQAVARDRGWLEFCPIDADWSMDRDPEAVRRVAKWFGGMGGGDSKRPISASEAAAATTNPFLDADAS